MRGQTLPIWVFGILISLALTFFVFNYANTVTQQVAAQNAANSAASALLTADANAANGMATYLYAVSVHDYKLSVLNDVFLTMQQSGLDGCIVDKACYANFKQTQAQYQAYVDKIRPKPPATSGLFSQSLASFRSSLKGGNLPNQLALSPCGTSSAPAPCTTATNFLNALLGPTAACALVKTDCTFTYSVEVYAIAPKIIVDVVACKLEPVTLASQFLGLTGNQFKAVGRATMTLGPLTSSNSSVLKNTLNTADGVTQLIPVQPISANLGNIDLGNLSVSTRFLVPVAYPPSGAANVPC